jgi:hypothetical protein
MFAASAQQAGADRLRRPLSAALGGPERNERVLHRKLEE